jgi:hypothetical protein
LLCDVNAGVMQSTLADEISRPRRLSRKHSDRNVIDTQLATSLEVGASVL